MFAGPITIRNRGAPFRCGCRRKGLSVFRVYAFAGEAVPELIQAAPPAEKHTGDGADNRLKYLIGKFHDGVFGSAVYERSAERVADHHDDRADCNADCRRDNRALFQHVMRKERYHDSLETVRHERDEHGSRIEEQVAEECADAADEKRGERVKDYRSEAYHDVVHVKMSAGYGYAEGAEGYVESHEHCGRAEPHGFFSQIRCFHWLLPLVFDAGILYNIF